MNKIKLLALLINTRDFHVKVKFNETITPCIAISITAGINRSNQLSSFTNYMIPHEPATQHKWYVKLILIHPEHFEKTITRLVTAVIVC
jgi:hypothetical protein